MKLFLIVLGLSLVLVFLPSTIQAAPFETGFIEWTQPDSTTFVARLWSDDFFWWMETAVDTASIGTNTCIGIG